MTSQKVAVVTGSNKGVGYAIVKGLCQRFDGVVYLTSRDKGRGEAALAKLKELGLNPSFYQLDINSQESVNNFKDYFKQKHGGIDILINNAAIAFKHNASDPLSVQAKETIKTNYFGTLRICEALFPLLRNNARVVNLSSSAGLLCRIPSGQIREKFKDPNLTIPQLNDLMEQFVEDAKNSKLEGWGKSCYVVSKVGVSCLSILQQRFFDKEQPERNISVNHVHPGYVDTDMTSHMGPLTIEEGARSTLFAALDSDIKGQYVWSNCDIVDWFVETVPKTM